MQRRTTRGKKRSAEASPEQQQQPNDDIKATKKVKKQRVAPLWERLTKSRDGKYLTIEGPNNDVKKALRNIGDEAPGVLLDWDVRALNAAVARVNGLAAAAQPALPTWMLTAGAYPITPEGLQHDIAADLAFPGGGLHGNALIAPNTLGEFGSVHAKIGNMMGDPFVIALCAAPNCRPLARIFTIADNKKKTTGEAAPPPQLNHGVRAFD